MVPRSSIALALPVLLALLVGCGPSLEPVVVTPVAVASAGEAPVKPTPAQAAVAEGFVPLGKSKGITIYERDAERGIELAVEGELPGSPDRIRRILLDYPAHKKWQERLAECEVLETSDDSKLVYERLSLPMIDDRDYTLRVTWGSDGDALWSRFTIAPDKGPPPIDGVVRVTLHDGAWTFTPREGGTATHAFYRFHLDIDSSLQSLGGGAAQEDLIDLFADIAAQLPNYP